MKPLIQIALIVFIGYILFLIFSDKKETAKNESGAENNGDRTMLLKGEVTGNFSLLNQTVLTVREIETDEVYHVLLLKGLAPKIGTPVILTIQKYDIVKFNDRSVTLYKELDTEEKKSVKKDDPSGISFLCKKDFVTFLPVIT